MYMSFGRHVLVALGREPADLVVINGNIVNVVTREVYPGGVAVADGRVAAVGDVNYTIGSTTRVVDAEGAYLTPGLIDGHVHVETSLMTYRRFAEAVMPRGTTAVVTDFHEVGLVAGVRGIKAMIDEARKTPLRLYFLVPVKLPFHPGLETVGGELGPDDVEELIKLPEAVGLSEIVATNLLLGDPDYLAAVEVGRRHGKTLEGHAPMLKDQALSAYTAFGVRSDHESFTAEEALQRVRNGLRLMMREGSVAKNLHETVRVLIEKRVDPRYALMITDDVDAPDLLNQGHLDHLIRRAVEEGVDPLTALQMVTINTAESYRIDHEVGLLAPGRHGDVLIVDDLEKFRVRTVIAGGEVVARDGRMVKEVPPVERDPSLHNTVRLARRIEVNDLMYRVERASGRVRMIVMRVPPHIPIIEHDEEVMEIVDGVVYPDPRRDVAQISVVERHGRSGGIGTAFVRGFNMRRGAIASSMAHDNHNIVVLGVNHEDMALAVNRIAELQGGQVVIDGGEVVAELPLPIAGLMSDEPPTKVAEKVEELRRAAQDLGISIYHPFMFLIFIPLAAIPLYAVTDKGFIDVLKQKIVSPVLQYL
ncbi:MAG: adenine deaminase [Zestosphaera sp.]